MPSPELGPRGGKYPHHIVQSILIPKDRKDVRGDPDRARVVAERYGARPGGKIAEQENYFAFRQVNPERIQPGSYISFKVPYSGVVLRKGLPIARHNPLRDHLAPHCDLSRFPVNIDDITPKQREELVELMAAQPRWWLEAKRESLPSLGTERVQKMADELFVEAMNRRARKNPTEKTDRWWAKAPKSVQEVYDSIAAHRDINTQFAAARRFTRERLLETALWNDPDGDYHLNDHESLAGYVVNTIRGTASYGPTSAGYDVIEYPPGHEYGARGNPPEEPGIGTFIAIGAVAVVGLIILGSRSRAQAATAPNPNAPVTPPPPRTVVRPTAPAPTYVRQADGFDPSSTAATRVLQQQLQALGYHVPAIDGVFGADTTRAVTAFLDANGMSFETTPARDIFQAIDSQYAYFFDTRGGLRSI